MTNLSRQVTRIPHPGMGLKDFVHAYAAQPKPRRRSDNARKAAAQSATSLHRMTDDQLRAERIRLDDAYGERPAHEWELIYRHSPQRPHLPELALQRSTGPLSHPEDALPEEFRRRARILAERGQSDADHDARSAAGLVSISTSQNSQCLNGNRRKVIIPSALRLSMLRKRVRWVGSYYRDHEVGRPSLLTLTYREVKGWDAKHVSVCLDHIRKWLAKRGHKLRYVWVAELQERGAVHFHAVIWLPRGLTLPKPDKQGWWKHGSTNIKWARKPVGYLTSYISKLQTKNGGFPKGLRLHGSGGLDAHVRATRAWRFLPQWLHVQTSPECRCTRAKGGGWVSRETGEWFESPYFMTGFSFLPGVGRVVQITRKEGVTHHAEN